MTQFTTWQQPLSLMSAVPGKSDLTTFTLNHRLPTLQGRGAGGSLSEE